MLVQRYVRGNGFEWSATFTDVNDQVADPDTVDLRVRYIDANGDEAFADIEMDSDTGGEWTGFWDSSVSKRCQVQWSIRAVNPAAAQEGKFWLDANLANPDPEAETA